MAPSGRMFSEHPKSQYLKDADPTKIPYCSSGRYTFVCPKEDCRHEFEMVIKAITINDHWCSYCTNQKLCLKLDCTSCRNKSFAVHPKAANWSARNSCLPHEMFKGSSKKVWFNCDKCPHDFEASLTHVSQGKGCPYCAHLKLCANESCQTCAQNSFQSHPKAIFWASQNSQSPREYFRSSMKECWFTCNVCTHDFSIALSSVSRGSWCNYCAHQKLCTDDTCQICFHNSFASHPKAVFWSDLNNIPARNVFRNSLTVYKFDCNKCNHTFQLSPAKISAMNCWCQYCVNHQRCGGVSCKWCFANSFASHPRSKYWSIKNTVKPLLVAICSTEKYIFDCPDCDNEYHQAPANIVTHNCGCPNCRHKTEKLLLEHLKTHFISIEPQPKFDWCRNPATNVKLPYDYNLINHSVLLELDGIHHFNYVMNWQPVEERHLMDLFKMAMALEQGYKIIRIFQPDTRKDLNWAIQQIQEALSSSKQVIYISKGDVYSNWDDFAWFTDSSVSYKQLLL